MSQFNIQDEYGSFLDARHIYTKLSFKIVKEPTAQEREEDTAWGGLTEMVYEIDKTTHAQEGMGMSYADKPASPEELAHYGVKGMKWGVRKAYTDRKSKEVTRLSKVADGKGGVLQKARTALGSSASDLVRGRGIEGAARIRRDRLRGHLNRLNNGKATARDVLKATNGVTVTDLARGAKLSRTRDYSIPETSRQRNRRLNKASAARDRKKRDTQIDAARDRYNNSARQNYLDAKARYKIEKKTLGTREARKRFDAVKEKNVRDFEIAQQAKSGRETTIAVLGTVGTVALLGLLEAASATSMNRRL